MLLELNQQKDTPHIHTYIHTYLGMILDKIMGNPQRNNKVNYSKFSKIVDFEYLKIILKISSLTLDYINTISLDLLKFKIYV